MVSQSLGRGCSTFSCVPRVGFCEYNGTVRSLLIKLLPRAKYNPDGWFHYLVFWLYPPFGNFIRRIRLRYLMTTIKPFGSKEYLSTDLSGKIVCYVFAGRRDRMSITVDYIDRLVADGQIDYVHIWNFNFVSNEADMEWIRSLRNKPHYTVFETKLSNYGQWLTFLKQAYLAHRYYAHSRFNHCGIVRVDDDIVFIDVAQFGTFRAKVLDLVANPEQDIYMVSANVVNNIWCDHYRQKRGLLPKNVVDLINLEVDEQGNSSSDNRLWDYGRTSAKLHRFFLDDLARLTGTYDGLQKIPIGMRHSTHLIGYTNSILPIALPSPAWGGTDEEGALTIRRSNELKKHVAIVNNFTAVHLSHRVQSRHQDDSKLIPGYRELVKTTVPSTSLGKRP